MSLPESLQMPTSIEMPAASAVADDVLASLRSHRQIPAFSYRPSGLSTGQAYQVTPLLRTAFEARGETIVDECLRHSAGGSQSPV
jgi:hypothetical protein